MRRVLVGFASSYIKADPLEFIWVVGNHPHVDYLNRGVGGSFPGVSSILAICSIRYVFEPDEI